MFPFCYFVLLGIAYLFVFNVSTQSNERFHGIFIATLFFPIFPYLSRCPALAVPLSPCPSWKFFCFHTSCVLLTSMVENDPLPPVTLLTLGARREEMLNSASEGSAGKSRKHCPNISPQSLYTLRTWDPTGADLQRSSVEPANARTDGGVRTLPDKKVSRKNKCR